MTSSRWNPRLQNRYVFLALLLLHLALLRHLASHDIVSAAFAAGPHTPLSHLALIAVFVAARLLVMLALPALITWHIVRGLLLWRCRPATETNPQEEQQPASSAAPASQ